MTVFRQMITGIITATVMLTLSGPATAQAVGNTPAIGPETNLPLPRFVSLRASEANVRRGPSLSHRVDWVFKRRDMPLQVIAEYGHWRRVIDRDGQGGWVHFRMLSGSRTVVVNEDMTPMHARPDSGAPQTAQLEQNVVASLGDCTLEWCRIRTGGFRGWVQKSRIWGVGEAEIRE